MKKVQTDVDSIRIQNYQMELALQAIVFFSFSSAMINACILVVLLTK